MQHIYRLAVIPVVLGLLVWYLPWEPDVVFGFPAPDTSAARAAELAAQPLHGAGWTRDQHTWTSHGLACDAWLFLPTNQAPGGSSGDGTATPVPHAAGNRRHTAAAPPPVVIMAAGMGAQRDHRLPDFAAQFAAAGYAAFLFDYRRWGGSAGEPRHLVWGWDHAGDYMAVVRHLKDTGGLGGRVDPRRIILWGSSYSGGHALVTASLMGCAAVPDMAASAAHLATSASAGAHGMTPPRQPSPSAAAANSGIVAVVVMEPFVSATLLVKRALYLNVCPVGRASDEATSSRSAQRGCIRITRTSGTTETRWLEAVASAMCTPVEGVSWVLGEGMRGLRILLVACSDVMRSWAGAPPAYMPLVLPESQDAGAGTGVRELTSCLRTALARLTTPISMGVMPDDDFQLFMDSRPKQMLGGWQNLVAARMLFGYPTYHPLHHVPPGGLQCPVRMVAGLQDMLTPLHTVQHAAKVVGPLASVTALNGTHITLYEASGLIPDMLQFLRIAVPLTAAR